MLSRPIILALTGVFLTLSVRVSAQSAPRLLSLQPADSLHRGRLWLATGAGVVTYGATMTGLYQAWYADFPSTHFHFFNDWREWQQMDKSGHLLMSYNE